MKDSSIELQEKQNDCDNNSKISDVNTQIQFDKLNQQDNPKINFFVIPVITIFKKNTDFKLLSILISIWLKMVTFEFIIAILRKDSHIVSDAFFNFFKMVGLIMCCLTIFITKLFSTKSNFIYNRIELISSLSCSVFLVIVSVHICLKSLHLLTEEHDHKIDVDFFRNFFTAKIILNCVFLFFFRKFIIHPTLKLKWNIYKRYNEWKSFDDFSFEEITLNKELFQPWDNHSENMYSLCCCLISDSYISLVFIVYFIIFQKQYYSLAHLFVSLTNFVLVLFLWKPLFNSSSDILMQGKSLFYDPLYKEIQKETLNFPGIQQIDEIKIWMSSQKNIKVCLKISVNDMFEKPQFNQMLYKTIGNAQFVCEFTVESNMKKEEEEILD